MPHARADQHRAGCPRFGRLAGSGAAWPRSPRRRTTGQPAARSARTASASVAPVVTTSSTTSAETAAALGGRAAAIAPVRLARRSSTPRPAESRVAADQRQRVRCDRAHRCARATARASRSTCCPPRARAAAFDDGTATSTVRPSAVSSAAAADAVSSQASSRPDVAAAALLVRDDRRAQPVLVRRRPRARPAAARPAPAGRRGNGSTGPMHSAHSARRERRSARSARGRTRSANAASSPDRRSQSRLELTGGVLDCGCARRRRAVDGRHAVRTGLLQVVRRRAQGRAGTAARGRPAALLAALLPDGRCWPTPTAGPTARS